MSVPLIYSPHSSPRITYVVDLIFRQFLRCPYQLHHHPAEWTDDQVPRIQYGGDQRLAGIHCFIPACGLLQETSIDKQFLVIKYDQPWPYSFSKHQEEADFPFDLFAFVFYLVSRYEEYVPGPRDQHQRFPARLSVAYQARFLHLPLVDIWVQQLYEQLHQTYPSWSLPKPSYHYLASYDIDMAWSYLHKGFIRQTGAALRDLTWGEISQLQERFAVFRGKQQDPFDTFDYMDKLNERLQQQPHYFILIGDDGPYDKNIAYHQKAFQTLIQRLDEQYPLGLHPSYQSNEHPNQLGEEKKRLEQILSRPISHSRQHYLRLNLPKTYRQLLAHEIYDDYSMGYAEEIGFRASTARPFYWYDLKAEQMRPLKIIPFQVMDVTLQQYLELSPEQALEQVEPMIQQVKMLGGTFVSLWHNSSFTEKGDWRGWRKVYEDLIEMARE
ncbi:MAG: polysaccharide deacetylase family protein [Bacteroidota bacterium]